MTKRPGGNQPSKSCAMIGCSVKLDNEANDITFNYIPWFPSNFPPSLILAKGITYMKGYGFTKKE